MEQVFIVYFKTLFWQSYSYMNILIIIHAVNLLSLCMILYICSLYNYMHFIFVGFCHNYMHTQVTFKNNGSLIKLNIDNGIWVDLENSNHKCFYLCRHLHYCLQQGWKWVTLVDPINPLSNLDVTHKWPTCDLHAKFSF